MVLNEEGAVVILEDFAQELGFASEASLEDASEVVVVETVDIYWFITRLQDGRWAAWDNFEISPARVAYFATREEAIEFHRQGFEISDLPEDAWVIEVPEEKVLVGDPASGHYFLRDIDSEVPEGWEAIKGVFYPREGNFTGVFKEEESGLYTLVSKGESFPQWSDDPLEWD